MSLRIAHNLYKNYSGALGSHIQRPRSSYLTVASKMKEDIIFSWGGGAQPIGVWEGGDKYNVQKI